MRQLQVQVAVRGATFLPVCEKLPWPVWLHIPSSPRANQLDNLINPWHSCLIVILTSGWKKHSGVICLQQTRDKRTAPLLMLWLVQEPVTKSSRERWKVTWEQYPSVIFGFPAPVAHQSASVRARSAGVLTSTLRILPPPAAVCLFICPSLSMCSIHFLSPPQPSVSRALGC